MRRAIAKLNEYSAPLIEALTREARVHIEDFQPAGTWGHRRGLRHDAVLLVVEPPCGQTRLRDSSLPCKSCRTISLPPFVKLTR